MKKKSTERDPLKGIEAQPSLCFAKGPHRHRGRMNTDCPTQRGGIPSP